VGETDEMAKMAPLVDPWYGAQYLILRTIETSCLRSGGEASES
jgi:hypothetical protein